MTYVLAKRLSHDGPQVDLAFPFCPYHLALFLLRQNHGYLTVIDGPPLSTWLDVPVQCHGPLI